MFVLHGAQASCLRNAGIPAGKGHPLTQAATDSNLDDTFFQPIAMIGHSIYPQITQILKEQDGDVVGYDHTLAFSLLRNLRNLRIDP